jgi:anthranilate synthase component 1
MKYKLKTFTKKLLADTLTPVNIYLKLRDVYAGSILLESSDYHGHENSLSFICCDPIASFQVQGTTAEKRYPDGTIESEQITKVGQVTSMLVDFRRNFEMEPSSSKYANCGLFGYMAYDSIRFFEDVKIKQPEQNIPGYSL